MRQAAAAVVAAATAAVSYCPGSEHQGHASPHSAARSRRSTTEVMMGGVSVTDQCHICLMICFLSIGQLQVVSSSCHPVLHPVLQAQLPSRTSSVGPTNHMRASMTSHAGGGSRAQSYLLEGEDHTPSVLDSCGGWRVHTYVHTQLVCMACWYSKTQFHFLTQFSPPLLRP